MGDPLFSAIRLHPEDVQEMRNNYFLVRYRFPLIPSRKPLVEPEVYFTPQEPRSGFMPPLPTPETFKNQVCDYPATPAAEADDEACDEADDEAKVWDVAVYFTNQKRYAPEFKAEKCYVPRPESIGLSEMALTETERTPCDVVRFGYRNGLGEFLSTPPPQPPPLPVLNAECYQGVVVPLEKLKRIRNVDKDGFGTEYLVCDSRVLIPDIHFKSSAKTEKGIMRFQERRDAALGLRKAEYQKWNLVLKESGFENDYTDKRTYCFQCGGTVFRKNRRCIDCGWQCAKSFGSWGGTYTDDDGSWSLVPGESQNTRTTQGVPSKKEFLTPLRQYFNLGVNPDGRTFNLDGRTFDELTAQDVEEITSDVNFATISAEWQITFFNQAAQDVAGDEKPNTIIKRISRLELLPRFHDVILPRQGWFCIVNLNGKNRLIPLGGADTPSPVVLENLLKERKKSQANAQNHARTLAGKHGWLQRKRELAEQNAQEGVKQAFDVLVGLFVPDPVGFGCTYYHFTGEELAEAAAGGWKP